MQLLTVLKLMTDPFFAAKALAELMKVVSHPDRIRLVEELAAGECDVNSLHDRLGLPPARVSQHLSILRAHRIVDERRDGRHHIYHLTQPELAFWIIDGMKFLDSRSSAAAETKDAVENARRLWTLNLAGLRPST